MRRDTNIQDLLRGLLEFTLVFFFPSRLLHLPRLLLEASSSSSSSSSPPGRQQVAASYTKS